MEPSTQTSAGLPARSAWVVGPIGALGTIIAVLPPALVAAMVVQIGSELDFGAAGLGACVAVFWLANAIASVPLGRVADRLGGVQSLRVAAMLAGACSLLIATLATRWWELAAFITIGGISHAIGHPGANRMLINAVRPSQQGVGFGIKGAAAPAASAVAGALVPVAVIYGWRWAFAFAAVISLAAIPVFGKRPPVAIRTTTRPGAATQLRNPRLVLFIAIVFGFGVASSMMVSVFYVDAAVAAGTSLRTAGLVLAVGSLAACAARIVTGSISDHMAGNQMELCAYMQIGGFFGVVLLATGNAQAMAIGMVIGLIGTWGPNAVFWYALTRHYSDTPGRITGAVQPGAAVGAVIGPATFGLLADHRSYHLAWVFAATITFIASVGTYTAARLLAARARQR